jgi:hypothetical protein
MIKLHRVDLFHTFNRKLKSNQFTAIFERTRERVFIYFYFTKEYITAITDERSKQKVKDISQNCVKNNVNKKCL